MQPYSKAPSASRTRNVIDCKARCDLPPVGFRNKRVAAFHGYAKARETEISLPSRCWGEPRRRGARLLVDGRCVNARPIGQYRYVTFATRFAASKTLPWSLENCLLATRSLRLKFSVPQFGLLVVRKPPSAFAKTLTNGKVCLCSQRAVEVSNFKPSWSNSFGLPSARLVLPTESSTKLLLQLLCLCQPYRYHAPHPRVCMSAQQLTVKSKKTPPKISSENITQSSVSFIDTCP